MNAGRIALRGVTGAAVVLALGCSDDNPPPSIRSLERSGQLTFVCGESDFETHSDGSFVTNGLGERVLSPPVGVPLSDCQDSFFEKSDTDEEGKAKLWTRRLYALVTQTVRGEVAVLDRTGGQVVNVDPQIPGESFLPIGAQPEGIATTPGGTASFVAVAEPGKAGIFAIPTEMILAPGENELPRDITNWPACSLNYTPGEVAIVLDPPDAEGMVRKSCTSEYDQPGEWEKGPPGRRKLAVTIPEQGWVALIDAEWILSRAPGSYEACDVERWIQLSADLPGTPIPQDLPPELRAAPECLPAGIAEGPEMPEAGYTPQPAGIALAQGPTTTNLYLGDRVAPVIHNLDMTDPCAPIELPPLLPRSFDNPKRVVTSAEIAVSPLFPKWVPQSAASPGLDNDPAESQRFLYAVDDRQGSLMIFDVSDPDSSRTPLVRPNSEWMPFEPPDRIAFSSPVRSLTFALTGEPLPTAEYPTPDIGILCDPAQAKKDVRSPGSVYKPNFPTLDDGAGPGRFRGVHAFAALADGQIAVIDVGDFDATCRLPATANGGETVDFRGCVPLPDAPIDTIYKNSTHEATCNVVEPHRARSAAFVESTIGTGVHAPSLVAFPRFQLSAEQQGEFDSTASPQMLAADFIATELNDKPAPAPHLKEVAEPAEVRVGTTLYKQGAKENPLVITPNAEELPPSSLSLMLREPRAYLNEESYTVSFEGAIAGTRPAGIIRLPKEVPPGQGYIQDTTVSFCGLGVQDRDLALLAAEALAKDPEGTPDNEKKHAFDPDLFADASSDYVQITQALVPKKDDWFWDADPPPACTYDSCNTGFGDVEPDSETPQSNFKASRNFRIIKAWANGLRVTPRTPGTSDPQKILEAARCCFGGGFSYVIRGSNQWIVRSSQRSFQHHIKTGPAPEYVEKNPDTHYGGACEESCNPLRRLDNGRVYETSCSAGTTDPLTTGCNRVGYNPASKSQDSEDPDKTPVACQFPSTVLGEGVVNPTEENPGGIPFNDPCVFQSSTQRFVVYRGAVAVKKDSLFGFTIGGGFLPLSLNLAASDTRVLPQTIQYNAEVQQLVITDGESQGVVFIPLNEFFGEPKYFF